MASQSQKTRLLKLSLFGKRKQGMSEEDFIKHRTATHRPLAVGWLAKHGIVRYALVSEMSRELRLLDASLMEFVE